MNTPDLFIPTSLSCPQVDVADPLEVARWSWLLDVADEQIRHAVAMVGQNGEAVSHYIEIFSRPPLRAH
jgi:hypothetical protein